MDYKKHTYTSIYIEKELQAAAKEKAKAAGISFSKLVETAIALYINKELKAG